MPKAAHLYKPAIDVWNAVSFPAGLQKATTAINLGGFERPLYESPSDISVTKIYD